MAVRAGAWLLFAIIIGGQQVALGQTIYTRAYGDSTATPVIFLHGGPGYSSVSFEVSTAAVLAEQGFYVIVYDRRGEGRSPLPAEYTFAQSVSDLDSLYGLFGLESAALVGHSFGGAIGLHFARAYPGRVSQLVLVGAPLSVPASLRHIRDRSHARYTESADSVNLNYIDLIDQMDTASLDYASYLLAHAVQNGFYRPAHPSAEADTLYARLNRDPRQQQVRKTGGYLPHLGFWTNERYTTLDFSRHIGDVLAAGVPVFGVYGLEDGLYSRQELDQLEAMLGPEHFVRLAAASHNVFIDQQPSFLTLIHQWLD